MTTVQARSPRTTSGALDGALDSVSDYTARLLATLRPLPASWTDLADADDLVLARDFLVPAITAEAPDPAGPSGQRLAAGTRLGPAEIGLLAAAGKSQVLVVPQPRVAVLSVGNELTTPGAPLRPGQVWESNGIMLAAAVRSAGATAARQKVVADRPDEVLDAIGRAARIADLLVTSGGISMGGSHDSIKSALTHLGTVSFRTVAMRPGKPQGYGFVGAEDVPIVTLPGNPVSAFVSFCLFVLPAIRVLQGRGHEREERARATLTTSLNSPAGKRSYVTATYDPRAAVVTPSASRTSHRLSALGLANALIDIPEHVTTIAAGDTADVILLP